MIFEEGYLHFEFDDGHWQILKFDKDVDYEKMMQALSSTKAVDFVGILEKNCYFIEVKDFRGYTTNNKQRLLTDNLAVEVGQKVKDSIACILGSCRMSSQSERWQVFVQALLKKDIKVILWLEHDLHQKAIDRNKARASVEGNVLKTKLRWLTTKVAVIDKKTSNLPHLKVTNLPKIK
ncbi:MAG: hypothetical protein ACRCYY_16555 [Trueperaceae bacterium]